MERRVEKRAAAIPAVPEGASVTTSGRVPAGRGTIPVVSRGERDPNQGVVAALVRPVDIS
jgi:hypothetical protein